MKNKYCAVLFSLDGDIVFDYIKDTKEEVKEELANRGSRWFFFPIETICKISEKEERNGVLFGDNKRIVDCEDVYIELREVPYKIYIPKEDIINKNLTTFRKKLKNIHNLLEDIINKREENIEYSKEKYGDADKYLIKV